jgi:hypothetical protein
MIVNMYDRRERRSDQSCGGADQGVWLPGAFDSRRGADGDRHRRDEASKHQSEIEALLVGTGSRGAGARFRIRSNWRRGVAGRRGRLLDLGNGVIDRRGGGDRRLPDRARWNRRNRSTKLPRSVAKRGSETAAGRRLQAAVFTLFSFQGMGEEGIEADARAPRTGTGCWW